MSGKAATIKLSERQLLILQHIERSTTAAARLIQRVRIILLAFGGLLNSGIAAEVGLKKSQVGLWRRRWRESFEALTLIECQESAAELERAMSVVLSDAPRSGTPATFSANEVTLILALACEPPGKSGRPIEQWTYRELADEIMKRKIVSSIAISQVWRILSEQNRELKKRCHSQCISVRFDSSCSICLPAQALIMAKSNRSHFWDRVASPPTRCEFQTG